MNKNFRDRWQGMGKMQDEAIICYTVSPDQSPIVLSPWEVQIPQESKSQYAKKKLHTYKTALISWEVSCAPIFWKLCVQTSVNYVSGLRPLEEEVTNSSTRKQTDRFPPPPILKPLHFDNDYIVLSL